MRTTSVLGRIGYSSIGWLPREHHPFRSGRLTPQPPLRNRVLIVDDDKDIRAILKLVLTVDEFDVVGEAASGLEAVAQAIAQRPDVVILDYMMPGENGARTAAQLRTLLPQARIVAFSAALESQPDWADAYLDKAAITDMPAFLREQADI